MKRPLFLMYLLVIFNGTIIIAQNQPTIEIELKYEITDIEALSPFLTTLDYQKTETTMDQYFDTEEGSFFKKGLWIRNRNNKKVEFKFNREGLLNQSIAMHPFCEEHSFVLPLQSADKERLIALCDFLKLHVPDKLSLSNFITCNSIQEMAVVNKTRTTYACPPFTIMIDDVKDIGHFLEIEFMAFDTHNVQIITTKMEDLLKDLPLQRTKTTYDAAWWKKYHFDIYQQGRYIRSSLD